MSASDIDPRSAFGPRSKARSQLATNRFLIDLGQVYERRAFTSRDVSNGFGLDFLKTSKELSRMSKRPYNLLSAVHVSRPYGGYKNSYTISPRGWSKISYLQGQSAPIKRAGRNPLLAAQYLVDGKGEEGDLGKNFWSKVSAEFLPSTPSPVDETGLLLFSFDHGVLPFELLNMHPVTPQDEQTITLNRALGLQRSGLVPADINIPLFLLNAYQNGSSGSAILLSLLIRGGRKLRDAYNLMKGTPKLDSEDCRRYKDLLEEEHRITRSLRNENNLLQQKLENASFDASLERFRINSRYVHHIIGVNQCLLAVSDGLKKFDDSSISARSMKSFTLDSFARIGLMNYLLVSSNRS